MKFFYLFLSIGLFFNTSMGQSRKIGSASALEGKIYILTIFISEKEWAKKEKLEIYDKLYEAEKWLTKQATNYGKKVSFEGGNFGLDKTIIMDNIHSGSGTASEPVDWISKMLKKVGYRSSLDFHDWVLQNTSCTQSAVLIFANKPGRGYAMAYNENGNKEMYFVEGAILYNEYSSGEPLASASIAHELLHLFGAWDLYTTFEQSQANEKKAKQMFPNDIMLRVSYEIEELEIGKLTAWLVGLSNKKEDYFEQFNPK